MKMNSKGEGEVMEEEGGGAGGGGAGRGARARKGEERGRRKKRGGVRARGSSRTAILSLMCQRPGRPKASVLPEPVSAMPTRSWRERTIGHACAWIGVGFAYFFVTTRISTHNVQ